MLVIKLPTSLKQQPHEQQLSYYSYMLFRSLANTSTGKPGFITKKEVQKIADQLKISKQTLLRRLNNLELYGYTTKSIYGWTIKAFDKVNHSLSFNQYTTKSGKVKTYKNNLTPYFKIQLPDTNDTRVIELAHHHFQLKQMSKRINHYSTNANKRMQSTSPEKRKMIISLERQKTNGNYPNTMYVNRLVNDLEKVNLLNVVRGKFNILSLQNDCNQYQMNPKYKANWSLLYKPKELSNFEKVVLANENKTSTVIEKKFIAKDKKPVLPKKKIVLSEVEIRFLDFINEAKPVLVDLGYLSSKFMTRKISRTMIPKLLACVLNSKFLKPFFLKRFSLENVRVTYKKSLWRDNKAFVYERFVDYGFDRVELTSTGGGNYNGSIIRTQKNEMIKSMNERKDFYLLEPSIDCI